MAANEIVITYDGTDITQYVMFETATFTQQADAQPGQFQFKCKDENQVLDFVTGKEITLDVDGFRLYGGYLLQVSRTFAFDADDTSSGDDYPNRIWDLRGVDYNILYDKRVLRDDSNPPASYLTLIDTHLVQNTTGDGVGVEYMLAHFVDGLSGFDTTSRVTTVRPTLGASGDAWVIEQGRKLRDVFESTLALRSGAVWYISPTKEFVYTTLESVTSDWGFSDQPNGTTSIGFREVEATEDGSNIVNDALVWGGGVWAGSGTTLFSRYQDGTVSPANGSQGLHGRWQKAEVHFGELGFVLQEDLDDQAQKIVDGPPGATGPGALRGLRFSQWQFRFTWFGQDVPLDGGIPQHLLPGDLVTIEMTVFGVSRILPLRSLTITFPTLDETGEAYVQFVGDFALNIEDPWTLWKYLQKVQAKINRQQDALPISTTNNSSTSFPLGSEGHFTPSPTPDGTTTLFTLPVGYIAGSLRVMRNSLEQTPDNAFFETNPTAGTFTMAPAPLSTDTLFVICFTLAG